MSSNNETIQRGRESIENWRTGDDSFPMRDESDEDLALVLEDQKTEAKDAVDAVTRALLNDSEPLTDQKALRVAKAAEALEALSGTLMRRVPEEHRVDEDGS